MAQHLESPAQPGSRPWVQRLREPDPRLARRVFVAALVVAAITGLDVLRRMWTGDIRSGVFLQHELSIAALAATVALYARTLGRGRARPWVVGLATATLLLANGKQLGSSDNFPADALPFRLVRSHTVNYDDFPCFVWSERYLVKVGEHKLSQYPLTVGILALPVFAPAVLGHLDPCEKDAYFHLAKIAGAVLTSIGVALMSEVFVVLAGAELGLLATLVYVLCTAVLSLLGQSLFQHTGAVFGLSIAAYGIYRAGPRLAPWLVGFGASLAVASRAFDVFVATGFVVAYLVDDWRKLPKVVLAGLGPVGAVVVYQTLYFGSPFSTGYGSDATNGWRANWFEGFAGELFSPARGLFVFSPVLLLALRSFLSGEARDLRRRRILGLGALVHIAVMAKWWAWHGAWCNSSRMVSDTLPVWGIALAAALPAIVATQRGRRAFAVLAALSLLPHAVVTFSDFGPSALRTYTYDLTDGPWTPRAYPPIAKLLPKPPS